MTPTLDELRKEAEDLGIKFAVRWNRATLLKKIRDKRLTDAADKIEADPPPPSPEQQRKPDFETLAAGVVQPPPAETEPKKERRGGYRENAGRTPGMTDEKARVNRIVKNEAPDPAIKFLLEALFAGWQAKSHVDGIALTDDESSTLAVPVTNLVTYYFPNLHITPVLEMWLGLAIASKAIIGGRIALIREARQAADSEPQPEQEKDAA